MWGIAGAWRNELILSKMDGSLESMQMTKKGGILKLLPKNK